MYWFRQCAPNATTKKLESEVKQEKTNKSLTHQTMEMTNNVYVQYLLTTLNQKTQ